VDYLYKYWIRLNKHLDTAQEVLDFQQTWEAYLIATSPNRTYYKSMGFRKNSIFPNRLAASGHHVNLDLFTFFNIQESQYQIFKRSSSDIERFVFIPFSETKGYRAVKKWLKFVTLSKAIRKERFYFKAFRSFD
jgi:hypothetical protein